MKVSGLDYLGEITFVVTSNSLSITDSSNEQTQFNSPIMN